MTTEPLDSILRDALRCESPDDDLVLARLRAGLDDVMVEAPAGRARQVRRRPVVIAAVVSFVAFAMFGVAAASGVIDVPGFRHHAAEQVMGLDDPDGPLPSADERRMLESMVNDITSASREPGVDYGPTTRDMPSYDDARLLLDHDGLRVSAIGSLRGDVCAVLFVDGSIVSGTCFTDFERNLGITMTEAGVTYGSARISSHLFGLAKADVTAIEIVDRSGGRSDAFVDGGAWAWAGGAGAHPLKIVIHSQDGTVLTRPVRARADFER